MSEPRYRNEWKYLISLREADLLKGRLKPFMHLDEHTKNGCYTIRSLYFDDMNDTAYKQKLMGVYARKKWRIRIYDFGDKKIALERKKKRGQYIYKESVDITREEFERILNWDYGFLLQRQDNLSKEFYSECMFNYLRPKVIVDYDRVPYVLDEGTVRITFDSDVRTAVGGFDIFDPMLPVLSAMPPDQLVLEVKYTEFLPQMIKQLLPLDGSEFSAFSKYVACYETAHHLTDTFAGVSKTFMGWRM